MFDQFHITVDVNLALQSRNEIEQFHLLDDIRRTEPAPGLLQGGCRLQMSGSRRHCRDQDAHVELLAESLADGAPERKKIPARSHYVSPGTHGAHCYRNAGLGLAPCRPSALNSTA